MGIRKSVTFQEDLYRELEIVLGYEDRTISSYVNHCVRGEIRKSIKRIMENLELEEMLLDKEYILIEKIKCARARRAIRGKKEGVRECYLRLLTKKKRYLRLMSF